MMITSYVPFGYEGIVVRVEADIRRGIPGFDISGLAAGAVKESRERVRAAFRNSGYQFPADRILINLAPADVKKDGAMLDLPIALAVMQAAGFIPPCGDLMVLGELELSGLIRPVRAVLAAAAAAAEHGITRLLVPRENDAEAAILSRHYAACANLDEAVQALYAYTQTGVLRSPHEVNEMMVDSESNSETDDEEPVHANTNRRFAPETAGDFAEVRAQERYKRAAEIAAAGAHNMLVFGPPGAGKTMLAARLPSIMPPLLLDEAVEVTRLYSLAGETTAMKNDTCAEARRSSGALIAHPPFRRPHHSASAEGILGGGRWVRPGEISMAHRGILFLDEAPEFQRNVLQSLREPLEERCLTISRAEGPVKLPADFQLVLAANPCPCGKLGKRAAAHSGGIDAEGECLCDPVKIRNYWRRFGTALLDRVELRVPVAPPKASEMGGPPAETSAVIAARVLRAVEIQRERFRGTAIRRNAQMDAAALGPHCRLDKNAKTALDAAIEKLELSGRAYHAILRVARTIADLEGKDSIAAPHILEAVLHRRHGDDPYDVFEAA